eukprot:m.344327 g.344327  ORF g.344327 m.344327 type:complete len:195 (-) comp24182_c0_seq1:544-1128(-)
MMNTVQVDTLTIFCHQSQETQHSPNFQFGANLKMIRLLFISGLRDGVLDLSVCGDTQNLRHYTDAKIECSYKQTIRAKDPENQEDGCNELYYYNNNDNGAVVQKLENAGKLMLSCVVINFILMINIITHWNYWKYIHVILGVVSCVLWLLPVLKGKESALILHNNGDFSKTIVFDIVIVASILQAMLCCITLHT